MWWRTLTAALACRTTLKADLNGVYAGRSSKLGELCEDGLMMPDEIDAVCKAFRSTRSLHKRRHLVILSCCQQQPDHRQAEKEEYTWDIGRSAGRVVHQEVRQTKLAPVLVDPFWAAYFSACEG
jgi:hypothetical protein